MERTMKITYFWKCDQGIEIPNGHKDCLEEDAQERIFNMISQGFIEGELSTSVRFGKDVVDEEEEEEGLSYSGYWKLSK